VRGEGREGGNVRGEGREEGDVYYSYATTTRKNRVLWKGDWQTSIEAKLLHTNSTNEHTNTV